MRTVVQHRLLGDDPASLRAQLAAGVEISIKKWKRASGNFQTHSMSILQFIAGRPYINVISVHRAVSVVSRPSGGCLRSD
jgi:hypothetical protein